MRWVPDSRSLAGLSIPGTHDTLAVHGGDGVVTQESFGDSGATLAGQLQSGMRAIDIRVHVIDGRFTVHHGAVYQEANFDDVLTVLKTFVTAHPAETVLMNLQGECSGALLSCTDDPPTTTPADIVRIFGEYRDNPAYKDLFYTPSAKGDASAATPTMGEVRGKVVLFRFAGSGKFGLTQLVDGASGPYYQNDWTVSSLDDISNKWAKVRDHLVATNNGAQDKIYVNYLSGASLLAYPYSVAGGSLGFRGVNEFALEYLFTQNVARTGVMMTDFAGPGLIGAVIARNYASASPARYALMEADAALTVRDLAASTGGDASARNDQLRSFLTSVTPSSLWDIAVAKQESGLSLGAVTVLGQTAEADGYRFAVATGRSATGVPAAELQGAVDTAVAQGLPGDAQAQSDALAAALRTRYPDQTWSAVVKRAPGGLDNWTVSHYGTDYKKVTPEYTYLVWDTDAFPATGSPDAGRASAASLGRAAAFLTGGMDGYGTGATLRLPRSYTGGFVGPGAQFGPDGYESSFVYDDALVIAALLHRGGSNEVTRATVLGDALLYAQQHDTVPDGRLRASYLPHPFITAAGTPYVGGFSTYTGNMAWAGMAWCRLYAATGDQRYLDGALRAANWIENNARDTRGAGGYTGGVRAADETGTQLTAITWKATEHNIDTGAFFAMLAQQSGDHGWAQRSQDAFRFVSTMKADDGRLWTGTGFDGVTPNHDNVPEDVQTWSYLATLDPAYSHSVDWAIDRLSATDGQFNGVSFSTADTSKVWFEGTAHLLAALNVRQHQGDSALAADLVRSLGAAQSSAPNTDGRGIVAASHDGLQTGEGDIYYASLHTGSTAWYLLAASGGNPFRL